MGRIYSKGINPARPFPLPVGFPAVPYLGNPDCCTACGVFDTGPRAAVNHRQPGIQGVPVG